MTDALPQSYNFGRDEYLKVLTVDTNGNFVNPGGGGGGGGSSTDVAAGVDSSSDINTILARLNDIIAAIGALNLDVDTLNFNTDTLEINTDQVETLLGNIQTQVTSSTAAIGTSGNAAASETQTGTVTARLRYISSRLTDLLTQLQASGNVQTDILTEVSGLQAKVLAALNASEIASNSALTTVTTSQILAEVTNLPSQVQAGIDNAGVLDNLQIALNGVATSTAGILAQVDDFEQKITNAINASRSASPSYSTVRVLGLNTSAWNSGVPANNKVIGFFVQNLGTVTQFVQVFNSATTPAAGAVPLSSVRLAPGSILVLDSGFYGTEGEQFSAGVYVAISSTNGTYTAATGNFNISIKHRS